MKVSNPIVERIEDNIEKLEEFKENISKIKKEKQRDIMLNFPAVYIHNWKNGDQY